MNLGGLRDARSFAYARSRSAHGDMLINKAAEERLLLRRREDNESNSSVHGDVFGGFEYRARRGVCLHRQATCSAGHTDRSIEGAALAIVLLHAVHINLHAADR